MRAFIMLPALALALIVCATAIDDDFTESWNPASGIRNQESFTQTVEESSLFDDNPDDNGFKKFLKKRSNAKKKMSSAFVDAGSKSITSAIKTQNYADCAKNFECKSNACAWSSGSTQACKPKVGFAKGRPCYYRSDCAEARACAYTTAKTLACKSKAGFALGKPCYYSADCESKLCTSGKCAGRGKDYESCKHNADCNSGYCRYAGDFANCSTKKGACKCLPQAEFADNKGCYWSSDCNSSYCAVPKKKPASGGKYVCFRRRRIPPGTAAGKRPSIKAPEDPCEKYKASKKADEELAKTLKQTVKFKANKTLLTDKGKKILKNIAETLNKSPWLEITVEGHSTAHGNYCKRLTTGRAQTSADFLKTLKCKNKMILKHQCGTFVGLKIASVGGKRKPPPGCRP